MHLNPHIAIWQVTFSREKVYYAYAQSSQRAIQLIKSYYGLEIEPLSFQKVVKEGASIINHNM